MASDQPPNCGCPCDSGLDFADCCADAATAARRLTPDSLEAWARARGVGAQLDVAASALAHGRPESLPPAHALLRANLTVGVALAPGRIFPPATIDAIRPLRALLWGFLRAEADGVAAAVQAEAAASPAPPVPSNSPGLALLAERLRSLRAEVRRTVPPRPLARLGHCTLTVLPSSRTLHFLERRRWVRDSSYGAVEPAVKLSFAGLQEGPLPPPSCTCEAKGPCTHLLAAIDLALAQLYDPQRPIPWEALGRELDTPNWTRALAGFDLLRAQHQHDGEADAQLRYSFVVADAGDRNASIVPYVHRRGRNGQFSKGKRVAADDLREGPGPCPPEDRAALARLGFLSARYRGKWDWRYSSGLARDIDRPDILLALAGHPRVYRAITIPEPLEVRGAELELRVLPFEGGGTEVATFVDGRRIPTAEILARLEAHDGGALLLADRERSELLVVRVADLEAMLVVLKGLARFGQHFPPEAESALLERVGALQSVLPVTISPELEGEETATATRHVLRLALRDAGLDLQLLARPLEGATLHPPGAGPARVVSSSGGRRLFAVRQLEAERRTAEELVAALPLQAARPTGPFSWTVGEDAEALALLEALRPLERPDLAVEWVGPPARVVRAATAKQLRVQVRDRHDWFGLAGTVEVDGEEVELAVLLEALRDRRKIVRLKGGAWLTLTAELAERLAPLAQLSTPVAGGLEIGPAALGPLDDLARDGAALDAHGAFARLHARMREASKSTPRVPRTFKGKLRDYQVEGFRWLVRLAAWGAGAILADDMGLGKTLQALALLCHRAGDGPALVVAPTSVCVNWVAEASRFAPSLRVTLFREADRASAVKGLGPGDVLVISYGLLALDLQRFVGKRFATLVLDEAQAVKNAGTRRAQAARALDADFRMALSGTPVENHLGELWSLFRIAFPGLLGSWEQFRMRFARPIEEEGDLERRRALAATLRPFLLRRTKDEVAPELPTRTEIALPVAPSGGERRLYEQARLAAVARLAGAADRVRPEQRRFQILAAITELRLLACHPRLYEPSSRLPSSKLARFVELVEELADEGHRALVFSQFTSHLALVREALDAAGASYLYLDGQTPPARRDELVARFQAGEGDLFLISLKAGGTGLNLTAADYVIHLDPWWNPAVEDQATDRAHRIGQTRPVTVYRLVSQGTIEETILALHAAKRALVAGILDGMDGAAKLSADDLMALIRTGPSQAEAPADDAVAVERDDREAPASDSHPFGAVRGRGVRGGRLRSPPESSGTGSPMRSRPP